MSIFSKVKDFFSGTTRYNRNDSSGSSGPINLDSFSLRKSAQNSGSTLPQLNLNPVANSTPTIASGATSFRGNNRQQQVDTPVFGDVPQSSIPSFATPAPAISEKPVTVDNKISSNNLRGDNTFVDSSVFGTSSSSSEDLGAVADRFGTGIPQQGTGDKELKDFLGLSDKLAEEGDRTLGLQDELGFSEANQAIADLNAQYASTKRNYEKRLEDIRSNPQLKSKAGINFELNEVTRKANSHLADIAIQQQAAQGNLTAINDTITAKIDAEFEPIRSRIDNLKDYFTLRNADLTDSEKLTLQSEIRRQESDYESQRDQAKNIEQAGVWQELINNGQYEMKDVPQDVVPYLTPKLQAEWTDEMIAPITDKLSNVNSLLDTVGSSNAVGPNPLARINLFDPLTASKSNFIAGVQRLTSQETLNTLIELKRAGGTLGALSEGEKAMLESAASNIGTWAQKDKNGNIVGYKTTEKAFTEELQRLQDISQKALLRADIVPMSQKTNILTDMLFRDNPTWSDEDISEAVERTLPRYLTDFNSVGNTSASKISKAIKQVESSGNYNAKGSSGEFGAYQFMPNTWKMWAGEFLGNPEAQPTKSNQDFVAESKISQLIDQGYGPEQIALIWNGGTPTRKKGVNQFGVRYDSGAYADKVIKQLNV
jgi:hypothetical protein